MSVHFAALVVKPKTARRDADAEVASRAFWRLMSYIHVHSYVVTTMPTVYVCSACGVTLRRVP